jgi:alpha-beta hydrolase superfamily lysophospholipase
MNNPYFRFMASAAISFVISAANAGTTKEKLEGEVTDFIAKAEFRQTPFLANPSLKIGVLHWPALGKGKPIVIVPGRGEVGYEWSETAFDLRTMGFQGEIFVWDPPGQGLSDRLLPDKPLAGHIEKFSDFKDSLVAFLISVNEEANQTPLVIAHSMGATIALNALEEDTTLASQLVLISPMLDIRITNSPIVKILAGGVVDLLYRLNLFQHTVIGQSGPHNPLTSDRDRFDFRQKLKDQFDAHTPGKTLSWIASALRGIDTALANADKIKIPILTFVAGGDSIIAPDGADELEQNCKGNCRLYVVEKSNHAMHEELDFMRGEYLRALAKILGLDCTNLLMTTSRTF